MTDYEEEQRNEMEALESIYPQEITVLAVGPPHSFELFVSSQCSKDDDEEASCVLQFTYTSKYPDEPPLMEITSSENLDDDHVSEVLKLMKELADDNVGMVMVFTLVSAVQEKLTEIVETVARQRVDEQIRREREAEEAEQRRFAGTHVNVESFLAWKAKFDAELAEIRLAKGKVDTGPKKLTGRELFMIDHSLDDSDVKFLEEGGEVVEVDESLFQDLDDLNLDDDGADDDEPRTTLIIDDDDS